MTQKLEQLVDQAKRYIRTGDIKNAVQSYVELCHDAAERANKFEYRSKTFDENYASPVIGGLVYKSLTRGEINRFKVLDILKNFESFYDKNDTLGIPQTEAALYLMTLFEHVGAEKAKAFIRDCPEKSRIKLNDSYNSWHRILYSRLVQNSKNPLIGSSKPNSTKNMEKNSEKKKRRKRVVGAQKLGRAKGRNK